MDTIALVVQMWWEILSGVLMVIGGLSVILIVIRPIVRYTKTTYDDRFVDKALEFLETLALNFRGSK